MKLLIYFSVLLFALTSIAAPPIIWSGNDAKILKPSLDLNGQSKIQSGTVDPTVTATSAPIGSIYLNSSTGTAYRKLDAGSSTNWTNLAIGSIAQSNVLGTIKVTGCSSQWSTTSTTFASFAPQTGCTYSATGLASAPSTMIPAITLSSIPAGEILFVFDGLLGNAASANVVQFRITDGTNFGREAPGITTSGGSFFGSTFTSSIAYSTPQTSVTLQIQALGSATSVASIQGSTAIPAVIKVYYFPTQAQTVLNPTLTPAYAGKTWATATQVTVGASAAASTTRTTVTSANFATYTKQGSVIDDTSTNLQTAAVLPAGEYEALYTGYLYARASAAGSQTTCVFDLYDGTSVLGSAYVSSFPQAAANVQGNPVLRGYFKLSGSTSKTVYLRASKINGDTSANSYCEVFTDPTATAMLTILPRTQSLPMPVIANSVISSSAGVEKVERATITTGTSCAVNSETGAWLGTATTCSVNGSVFPITGFSGAPTCTISGNAADGRQCQVFSPTTSSISVYCYLTSTLANGATTANIICQGPK